mmetsp:Transcript_3273/g.6498  ORF Transcript_3273/g.6498 Transcript_3273/m.6498 type:complete len:228 (+) Transcript_3273:158-841(+)
MDPKEGNSVTWYKKGVETPGVILKRNGLRVRIASPDGKQHWAEVKDVTAIDAAATVSKEDLLTLAENIPNEEDPNSPVKEPQEFREQIKQASRRTSTFSEDFLLAMAANVEDPDSPQQEVEKTLQPPHEAAESGSSKDIKPAFFKMMLNDEEEDGTKNSGKTTAYEAPGMAEHFATFAAGAAQHDSHDQVHAAEATEGAGDVDPDLAALMESHESAVKSDEEATGGN